MVGSQVVQIAQQMKANQQLQAIHSHHLSQAEAEARLNWIREQIFLVRQNFESAALLLETNPSQAYYICESNFLFLHREAISSRSFNDLAEKEYFGQLWQYAENIRTHARSALSEETAHHAMQAAISQAILPQLRSLAAWTEIAELLPNGILKNRYSDWQRPVYRWTSAIVSLAFFPFLVFPLYLWITDPYPKILPRIHQLAQSVGGWVSDHIKRKDALQIANQHRAVLERWGLQLPAEATSLNEAVSTANQMVGDFTAHHLQLA